MLATIGVTTAWAHVSVVSRSPRPGRDGSQVAQDREDHVQRPIRRGTLKVYNASRRQGLERDRRARPAQHPPARDLAQGWAQGRALHGQVDLRCGRRPRRARVLAVPALVTRLRRPPSWPPSSRHCRGAGGPGTHPGDARRSGARRRGEGDPPRAERGRQADDPHRAQDPGGRAARSRSRARRAGRRKIVAAANGSVDRIVWTGKPAGRERSSSSRSSRPCPRSRRRVVEGPAGLRGRRGGPLDRPARVRAAGGGDEGRPGRRRCRTPAARTPRAVAARRRRRRPRRGDTCRRRDDLGGTGELDRATTAARTGARCVVGHRTA